MASQQQRYLLPITQAPVLRGLMNGFTTVWYQFFEALVLDDPQIGDCLVMAGPLRDNYLKCDGSAVARATYNLLFAVIGTTYGAGDGVTTFNLPNFASPGAPSFWAIHYL